MRWEQITETFGIFFDSWKIPFAVMFSLLIAGQVVRQAKRFTRPPAQTYTLTQEEIEDERRREENWRQYHRQQRAKAGAKRFYAAARKARQSRISR